MAAIVWSDVTNIASTSLASVSVAAQTLYLLFANEAIDTRLFPNGEEDTRLKLARIYLAAHYAASGVLGDASGGVGAAGPVTAESAGTLSRSYASMTSSTTDPGLESTQWGKLYRLIMRPMRGGITL